MIFVLDDVQPRLDENMQPVSALSIAEISDATPVRRSRVQYS